VEEKNFSISENDLPKVSGRKKYIKAAPVKDTKLKKKKMPSMVMLFKMYG